MEQYLKFSSARLQSNVGDSPYVGKIMLRDTRHVLFGVNDRVRFSRRRPHRDTTFCEFDRFRTRHSEAEGGMPKPESFTFRRQAARHGRGGIEPKSRQRFLRMPAYSPNGRRIVQIPRHPAGERRFGDLPVRHDGQAPVLVTRTCTRNPTPLIVPINTSASGTSGLTIEVTLMNTESRR